MSSGKTVPGKTVLCCLFVVCGGFCAAFTDYYIGELKAVDLPEGRCAGHAPTGICWMAQDNMKVDIVGRV